ncbi:MAG: hypothetical protein R2806_23765 [Saprospiraceae bacterium]
MNQPGGIDPSSGPAKINCAGPVHQYGCGPPYLQDILQELEKPGLDPRGEAAPPSLQPTSAPSTICSQG